MFQILCRSKESGLEANMFLIEVTSLKDTPKNILKQAGNKFFVSNLRPNTKYTVTIRRGKHKPKRYLNDV